MGRLLIQWSPLATPVDISRGEASRALIYVVTYVCPRHALLSLCARPDAAADRAGGAPRRTALAGGVGGRGSRRCRDSRGVARLASFARTADLPGHGGCGADWSRHGCKGRGDRSLYIHDWWKGDRGAAGKPPAASGSSSGPGSRRARSDRDCDLDRTRICSCSCRSRGAGDWAFRRGRVDGTFDAGYYHWRPGHAAIAQRSRSGILLARHSRGERRAQLRTVSARAQDLSVLVGFVLRAVPRGVAAPGTLMRRPSG